MTVKASFDLQRPSIPVSYLQVLVEIVAERGVTLEQLLAGITIAPTLLQQPEARMSAYQWTALVSNAIKLTGDPGLGYEYGLRLRPSAHGFLGYATLSCTSMRQALEITLRYFQARQREFTMNLRTEGEYGMIEVRETHPIPVLRAFFLENILLGVARGASAVIGADFKDFPEAEITTVAVPFTGHCRNYVIRPPLSALLAVLIRTIHWN